MFRLISELPSMLLLFPDPKLEWNYVTENYQNILALFVRANVVLNSKNTAQPSTHYSVAECVCSNKLIGPTKPNWQQIRSIPASVCGLILHATTMTLTNQYTKQILIISREFPDPPPPCNRPYHPSESTTNAVSNTKTYITLKINYFVCNNRQTNRSTIHPTPTPPT